MQIACKSKQANSDGIVCFLTRQGNGEAEKKAQFARTAIVLIYPLTPTPAMDSISRA